jgi:aryl-alcohol dehydrogenase-like predicted oxidoreductase
MEFAVLGTSGCTVSRLGFGCAPAGAYDYGPIDETAWITAVHAALSEGINFFDVADVYGFGRAEELLSRALGERRHDVVIATKGGLVWDEQGRVTRDSSRVQIARAIESSLRRLRVEAITLYQIHWPDLSTPIEETLETLVASQKQGKIRIIGMSNFPLELLQSASRFCRFESVQVPYNLLCRQIEGDVLTWCESAQISVLTHSSLARGLLAGKRPIGSPFAGTDTRGVSNYFSGDNQGEKKRVLDAATKISLRVGRSVSSVALRWILDAPGITMALAGVKNCAQLKENLQAVGWQLAEDDRNLLSSLSSSSTANSLDRPAAKLINS